MQVLPKWVLTSKFPAIHDSESLTVIEQTARIYGAMNSLIEEYNAFAENVNNSMEAFATASEADREQFKISMRQEFQDFIDVIDMKVKDMEIQLTYTIENIEKMAHDAIDEAVAAGGFTMETLEQRVNEVEQNMNEAIANIDQIVTDTVNEAFDSGKITVSETYDPETESLNMSVSGGV